ncbi:alpha-hydroxy-acid oxidizing protein [Bradyrhizobium sp. CSA207]|uniref:alpha-hydroxy acid oxidase n=1 Tax=Bradyrhizobium sp. CSA207 TaxID=2698826 RepID=UPI0023B1C91E|nr:alpha-hydroxy acid oxidase [Bradyrhizobium sp. CSA207]MDE5446759.1 alpha-hydroxy-acid oxidizing protein [Bradyrhizobium sp. CSA207]
MKGVVNADDLRKLAKKRLPKICYDYIEGGTDDEIGLITNEQAFRRTHIVPRYLVDVSARDQSTNLFGRSYSSPIGIAPTGSADLFRRGADLMLAEAARDANVPFIMSGASSSSIEDLAKVAPDHSWYQVYSAIDPLISEDMIKRVSDAGLKTLVFTVDVPIASNRERSIRNGWGPSQNLTWRTKFEALRHPTWMIEWLQHGTPHFDNWTRYAGPNASAKKVADFVIRQFGAPMTWKHVERYRELWKGNFVLKGIMHPDDAVRAHSLGVDGIMVSNHGARQLDHAPAPLDVLPAIRDAVGDRMTVMLDGGIRRGLHVLIALCLGAKFVFQGRPTLYGVSAGGVAGAEKALAIFRREIDISMAQIGSTKIAELGPQFLMWQNEEHLYHNRREGSGGRL